MEGEVSLNPRIDSHGGVSNLRFAIWFGLVMPQVALWGIGFVRPNNPIFLVIWYVLTFFYMFVSYKYLAAVSYLKPSPSKIFIGLLGGILVLILEVIFAELFPNIQGSQLDPNMTPFIPLYACICGPLWEEVLFRGILNKRIFRGSILGLVVSSLGFSLLHDYLSPLIILYFLMALIFSFCNRGKTDISASIVAHMVVNTVVFFLNF
ncbi:CPBP family intramembrane metalloprotease [Lacticaseibacillus casei]|uniref:CPBP family intramembrane metalloprotease n=1 Tax=Lacticaseibacillus huelsenbergensis TaxID=3035291 RepID=A0ABY8DT23_9LACO|nr:MULTISPECIES: CPBP family intramembrane glutamic endopeptidase [Lacticaseibacillus]MDG3061424.1 CPBP family intramembrane metalloprotease [Lacticaseibacillus sp. BCRC 81376]QVI37029.1 CPBP family intramembrane metalloprotease [Lacticaseibacillus casei]QXG58822.1 CPBP family intramembrane metalloprotease [Lacticaseibacillus casei]WFB39737.1 CPBP family intramembrane metalloprotease [Lacticaseibacillus huelsenbergensis]WFB41437.1 CPBP family intramembrane metalloprotease [Lacticaseibacillus h